MSQTKGGCNPMKVASNSTTKGKKQGVEDLFALYLCCMLKSGLTETLLIVAQ